MKLVQQSFKDTVLGAEKEMDFSISNDSSIIFEILRDKMYSNKIGSICREVSSNSRDANREAGNADLPIEIHVVQPNDVYNLGSLVGHLSIVFKDYGVGISPDRMENVFVKYAASTKRDSNSQTGGFGLGAKTPFAYTDTFTIITTCMWEGKLQRFTYTAMIDSSRKGKMILFETEDVTDIPTGTEIVIPINTPEDQQSFEQECYNFTSFWGQNAVKYIGFSNEFSENILLDETDGYAVYHNEDGNHKYRLLIDGVPYPLETDSLEISRMGLGDSYCLALKFDVGQINISANREAIQYDTNTVKLIQDKYDSIKKDLLKVLTSKLNSFDTYIGACIRHSMLDTRIHEIRYIEDVEMKMLCYAFANGEWRGEQGILSEFRDKITKETEFEGREIKKVYDFKHHRVCFAKDPGQYGKPTYPEVSRFKFTSRTAEMKKYYADKKRNIRRNRTIWEEKIGELQDTFMLISPKGDDIQAQLDEMIDFQEVGFEFEMYSDIPMKKGDASGNVYVAGDTVAIKCRKYQSSAYDNNVSFMLELERDTFKVDPDYGKAKDYVYYVVDTLKEVNEMAHGRIGEMMRVITELANKKVLIVGQTSYDRHISKSSIKCAKKLFKKLKKKHQKQWIVQRDLKAIKNIIGRYNCGFTNQAIVEYAEIFPKELVTAAMTELDGTFQYQLLCDKDSKFDIDALSTEVSKVDEKYPMMQPFLEDKDWTDKNRAIVKNYIDSVA